MEDKDPCDIGRNLVQEIDRSWKVQEIWGVSGDSGTSVNSREVQKVFGGEAKFESPKRLGRSIFGECMGWFVKSW